MHGLPGLRNLAGALLALAAAWIPPAAFAQSAAGIVLTPPSAEAFPQITFFASVIGPDGRRIHALPPTSFGLTEDGSPVPGLTVEERPVGSRQIFVINTVSALRRRDALGVNRLAQIREALVDTWTSRPASAVPDQVSLLLASETLASNRPAASDLVAPFEAWEESFSGTDVGYQALLTALRLALDPLPSRGMEVDVVFATPLLDRLNEQSLAEALSLARDSGARIHAVLIGTVQQAGVAEALRLRQAAEASGGTFRVFDPQVGLADLEATLRDVRTRYAVTYDSLVSTSGPHTIELTLTTPDITAVSEPAAFEVTIAPPQVAFIQPPSRLVRQTDDPDTPLADIPPTFVELPLLVTFTDDHPRPLTQVRLFVNGAVHETRAQPPFDFVRWDLSTVVESGGFQLRADVIDSQGLLATTETLRVTVEVIPGPRGLQALRPALAPLLGGLLILGAAAGLAALWVRLGDVSLEPAWQGSGLRRASLGTFGAAEDAEAYLIPSLPDASPGETVALAGGDLTIGSDPTLCGLLLADPSVSAIHARLTRRAAGAFHVRDQHSVAGTWVNDEPVGEAGRDLGHGDRIHFGRTAYIFRLASGAAEPRLIIQPLPPRTSP